jgi:Rrf2 family iron-sulfur cluster assembly transcriptional regulator
MNLSTKGRYAVMAMSDLARNSDLPSVSLAAVAERQAISRDYLVQLFAKLKNAGLVTSVRGRTGGYQLSSPARDIRILDIMHAAEESFKTTRCCGVPEKGCVCFKDCLTHDLWNALEAHIAVFLHSVTLADVLDGHLHAFVAPGPGCPNILSFGFEGVICSSEKVGVDAYLS